ncbi:MAG: GbsR/MarR family transcriptional regulator [Hyphomicrobiales bacterium]|nr:GbsR/MarR family transcriptional regulator [Hyphomicrobiales bacterium]
MNLSSLAQDFVLHFGEMGSRWGINRTVGQIYALLFLSAHPLNAEQIVHKLGFSRSNVSMGLKELQSWNLVHLKHLPDDRRDYFATPDDLWEIVRTLIAERKKREIDPTLTKLRALEMESSATDADAHALHKIAELRQLVELLTGWYDDMNRLETDRLVQLLALGSKLQKFVSKAEIIVPLGLRSKDAATRKGDGS